MQSRACDDIDRRPTHCMYTAGRSPCTQSTPKSNGADPCASPVLASIRSSSAPLHSFVPHPLHFIRSIASAPLHPFVPHPLHSVALCVSSTACDAYWPLLYMHVHVLVCRSRHSCCGVWWPRPFRRAGTRVDPSDSCPLTSLSGESPRHTNMLCLKKQGKVFGVCM